MVGTDPSWLTVRGRSMTEGRFIAGHDLTTQADVVVLGSTTAEELFGARDPVGQTGHHQRRPDDGHRRAQHGGLVGPRRPPPTRTTRPSCPSPRPPTQLFGGTSRNSVSDDPVQATSSSTLSAAYQEADAELLSLHGITTPPTPTSPSRRSSPS